jgi:hypothetical protein
MDASRMTLQECIDYIHEESAWEEDLERGGYDGLGDEDDEQYLCRLRDHITYSMS